MELCFVLRADIKEGAPLLFGMHGQKVGTQSLPPRNSDGICNADHSVPYCVGPNGPWCTMTGKPKARTGTWAVQTNKETDTHIHAHGGSEVARFEMHSIVLFNFAPILDYFGKFVGVKEEFR